MNVSELLSRTSDYLGRPTQDKLSLGIILPFLLDSINFYGVDLQLSSENWLLTNEVITPSAKEELVTLSNFSVPVAVEVRSTDSSDEADWKPIQIINASDVQDIGRDGDIAVAFYGTPPYMRWSFDPADSSTELEAKIWYEPRATEPSALTSSPQISQAFHSMITIRTALLCAPHIGLADATQLTSTLSTQLGQWEGKWKMFVNIDRNSRPVQKRDFRGARRLWQS
jgi:hypothetical protein